MKLHATLKSENARSELSAHYYIVVELMSEAREVVGVVELSQTKSAGVDGYGVNIRTPREGHSIFVAASDFAHERV